MDLDPPDPPSERAASSEATSTRLNPFHDDDDDHQPSSRKRQRLDGDVMDQTVARDPAPASMSSASPDTSVDGSLGGRGRRCSSQTLDASPTTMPSTAPTHINLPSRPQTPPPAGTDPNSDRPLSKVTLNLRTPRTPPPASASASSPSTPSKSVARESIEPADQEAVPAPAELMDPAEDVAGSPSATGSPQIELVTLTDDEPSVDNSPPVTIIGDEETVFAEQTLMARFPYQSETETRDQTVARLARYFELEPIENDDAYNRVRQWIARYLDVTANLEAAWYDMYCENRIFWSSLPELVWALSHRRTFFGQFLRQSRGARRNLTEFFGQYARLTGRMLTIDLHTILRHGDAAPDEPDLVSRPYLTALSHLLRREEANHIGSNLEEHYSWAWEDDVKLMLSHFMRAGGDVPSLTTLVRRVLPLITQCPKLADYLVDPCRLVHKITIDAMGKRLLDTTTPHEQVVAQSFQYYQLMSSALDDIIDKQSMVLNQESALLYVTNLSGILCAALNVKIPGAEMPEHIPPPELPHRMQALLAANEWRFKMFKKLIMSGHMQLRVAATTTLCTDLLNAFSQYRRDDLTVHPLLQHYAALILDHGLVEYIVGPGSHPEIMMESGNIVGFLIATKTYRPQDTDTIWHTILTSRNPRVVDAILRMLVNISNLFDYTSLLHFCEKACELPLDAFTAPMRECLEKFLGHLMHRCAGERNSRIDAQPYDLMCRLIRETCIITSESPKTSVETQAWATARLRELVHFGPSAELRNVIYAACLADIKELGASAPGSVCILTAVLRAEADKDLQVLCSEHNLTALLIHELQFVQREAGNALAAGPASAARRELLLQIIVLYPASITEELGERLWALIVGSESGPVTDHQIAWQLLIAAAKRAGFSNRFIAKCFDEYMPQLDPARYTIGALDFVREGVSSKLQLSPVAVDDSDAPLDMTPMEQIWRIILTSPCAAVEMPAIATLAEMYMEWPTNLSLDRATTFKTHMSLVNRCLEQLSTAAAKLTQLHSPSPSDADQMAMTPPPTELVTQERVFSRCLILLREFLRGYQQSRHLAPPRSTSPTAASSHTVEGEPLKVTYQTFDGGKTADMKTLDTGSQNTIASLFASLQEVTGFRNYKLYHLGKLIDPDDVDLCTSLAELNLGHGLVLVQRRDGESMLGKTRPQLTALELAIVKRFDELWEYLAMEEKLAKEIYFFLTKFPVYEKLVKPLESGEAQCADTFPANKPFKSLYAVHALREHVSAKLQAGNLSDAVLTGATRLIVEAITTPPVLDSIGNEELRQYLALHILETLIQFLREPRSLDKLEELLDAKLANRLLDLLADTQGKSTTQNGSQLISKCFEALMEASVYSPSLWTAFISHPDTSKLLFHLVLAEPYAALRKQIVRLITSKCNFSPSLGRVSAIDIVRAFWPLVLDLVPRTPEFPRQCAEAFMLVQTVFRKLAELSPNSVNLGHCLSSWGQLLLEHDSLDEIGKPESVDQVAQGLASLLYWCVSFVKASGQPLVSSDVALRLFEKHMFPELSASEESELRRPLPLLNKVTRKLLIDTIFGLVKDDAVQYRNLVRRLHELVPYNRRDPANPYSFELTYFFDRHKFIRSPTGYVGLRNLSNTCYLNSLFTQLFMNVSFRKFMLDVRVTEAGAAQKLLFETQKLFGFMQNSIRRSVDPTNVAASIRTYEDTNIDVTIQMDVDEFYNLLFDRWESQILSPDAKRTFKSLYGGQLVQQVKSKECSHISERLELFSAIQCDIKGKSSLQESLQAYVDGEIMEGDNKYKCSTCDRHVDAVKRACLKDIPDNLIFHLKRFDFNLRTLQRSKINDYFSFPHRIDMRPYKVEHLMESPIEAVEDVFELTGILVHSGTAESGHYYSCIRDKPSINGEKANWIEFNDDTVSQFDPNTIESTCFGGQEYRTGNMDGGPYQYDKGWSAYMLFYQRSSAVAAQLEELASGSPVKLPIPSVVADHIDCENELILRKYCLHDENHAVFVNRILDALKNVNKGQCSEKHQLEQHTLVMVLNHLDQVISRAKDIPSFQDCIHHLKLTLQACTNCALDVLEWFVEHPEAFRNMVLRNPESLVRGEACMIIMSALNKLKQECPEYYLSSEELGNADDSDADEENPQIFKKTLDLITKYWDVFHSHTRAWPEYFGLLNGMARLGSTETAMLLDAGFLLKCLEIVSADVSLSPGTQYLRMLTIVSKKPASRPVSYENIIALLDTLLQTCELREPTVQSYVKRLQIAIDESPIPVSHDEYNLLTQHWTRSLSHILCEKLLILNQNERSTQSIIRKLLAWEDEEVAENIVAAIRLNIRRSVTIPAGPFLKAALTFCEMQPETACLELLGAIGHAALSSDTVDSREYLNFFKRLQELTASKSDAFWAHAMHESMKVAPAMLMYFEEPVRDDAEEFYRDLCLLPPPESDEMNQARADFAPCATLGTKCLAFLDENHVRLSVPVVQANLTHITRIIEACKVLMPEAGSEARGKFFELYEIVVPMIRRLVVDEVEEDGSDWDASDDAFSSSEAMDNVAELGTLGAADMDPEV